MGSAGPSASLKKAERSERDTEAQPLPAARIQRVRGRVVDNLPDGAPGTVLELEDRGRPCYYGFGSGDVLKTISENTKVVVDALTPPEAGPGYSNPF